MYTSFIAVSICEIALGYMQGLKEFLRRRNRLCRTTKADRLSDRLLFLSVLGLASLPLYTNPTVEWERDMRNFVVYEHRVGSSLALHTVLSAIYHPSILFLG